MKKKSQGMTTYQIRLPESLQIKEFDLQMMIASYLFSEGKLSSGQASKIVGLSKRSFIELLGKYQVSLFSQDIEELQSDIANA